VTTIREVRAAIVDALDSLTINTYAHPVDAILVPAAVVAGFEMTELTLGGGRDTTARVLVVVSKSHTSQLELLDELLDESGAQSVVEAINARADDTISLSVESVDGYGEIVWGDVSYYGAVVTVKVFT
jgi:hypothetical protein